MSAKLLSAEVIVVVDECGNEVDSVHIIHWRPTVADACPIRSQVTRKLQRIMVARRSWMLFFCV